MYGQNCAKLRLMSLVVNKTLEIVNPYITTKRTSFQSLQYCCLRKTLSYHQLDTLVWVTFLGRKWHGRCQIFITLFTDVPTVKTMIVSPLPCSHVHKLYTGYEMRDLGRLCMRWEVGTSNLHFFFFNLSRLNHQSVYEHSFSVWSLNWYLWVICPGRGQAILWGWKTTPGWHQIPITCYANTVISARTHGLPSHMLSRHRPDILWAEN